MTKETKNRIPLIYGIVLSAVIVIAGLCLMAACVGIYHSGDEPFSREAVAIAFSVIAIPVYLCLFMVIGGFVLELFIPRTVTKPKLQKQYSLILRQLRADGVQCDDAIRAERKKRALCRYVTAGLLIAGSAVFLCYALDSSHFHQTDINGSMVQAMWVLLPCMAIPYGFAVFTAYYSRRSMQREIDLLKQAGAKTHRQELPPATQKTAYMRWGLLIVAAVILIYGFCTGGTMDVLTKAINICTECVGLG